MPDELRSTDECTLESVRVEVLQTGDAEAGQPDGVVVTGVFA